MTARVNLVCTSFSQSFSFSNHTITWYIDSGATHHICCNLSNFSSYHTLTHIVQVQLPDGTMANVEHISEVDFSPLFTLQNVFHISSFTLNLIYVTQLTKHLNCVASFSSTSCFFRDLTMNHVIGKGLRVTELYKYQTFPSINSANNTPLDVWHCLLGHPSLDRFKFICNSFAFIHSNFMFHCNVCPKVKQLNLAFNKNSILSTNPFQMMYRDVKGLFFIPSSTGARYFLTIVDNFSRCTWLYLMHSKSETFEFIKKISYFCSHTILYACCHYLHWHILFSFFRSPKNKNK